MESTGQFQAFVHSSHSARNVLSLSRNHPSHPPKAFKVQLKCCLAEVANPGPLVGLAALSCLSPPSGPCSLMRATGKAGPNNDLHLLCLSRTGAGCLTREPVKCVASVHTSETEVSCGDQRAVTRQRQATGYIWRQRPGGCATSCLLGAGVRGR